MPSETPEQGDKVSWSWGSGNPSGEVKETKTDGEVTVTSKRGNDISKSATPGDAAVAIAHPNNDVVKKASELKTTKPKTPAKSSADSGTKRAREDDTTEGEPSAKKGRGRPKGKSNGVPKAQRPATKPTRVSTRESKVPEKLTVDPPKEKKAGEKTGRPAGKVAAEKSPKAEKKTTAKPAAEKAAKVTKKAAAKPKKTAENAVDGVKKGRGRPPKAKA